LTSGRWPVVKIITESLSQHDEKHVVPTPLSGIRVGRRRSVVLNVIVKFLFNTVLKLKGGETTFSARQTQNKIIATHYSGNT
jgi:hypothetical protein